MPDKQPNLFKRFFNGLFLPASPYNLPNQNNTFSIGLGNIDPRTLSSIYTCIRILSETLSKIPCYLVNKSGDDKEFLKDESLYKLLRYSPNNYMNITSLISTLETHRNLTGNSYALIVRKNGKPDSLELVYPLYMSSLINTALINTSTFNYIVRIEIIDGQLYYIINKNGNIITVSGDDVLHFKTFSLDGFSGISPIDSLRQNVNMSLSAFNTINSYYQNSNFTTKYLKSTLANPNIKMVNQTVDRINEANKNTNQKGGLSMLPLNTEMVNDKMSFVDAALIETIKFNNQQIGSVFGVPGYYLGERESMRFTSIEQEQLAFKTNTIHSNVNIYEEEFNNKLLTQKQRDAGWEFEFDLNSMIEIDYKTKIQGYKDLFAMGVISPNNIAKLEGFETYDGGNKHYIMTNLGAPENSGGTSGQAENPNSVGN